MEGYISQLIPVGLNFSVRSGSFAQGQQIAISQFQALFSLISTYYGGDGRNTFCLPDLRGRTPMGSGQGPGLTTRYPGHFGGLERTVITTTQLPQHTHGFTYTGNGYGGGGIGVSLSATKQLGTSNAPAPGSYLAANDEAGAGADDKMYRPAGDVDSTQLVDLGGVTTSGGFAGFDTTAFAIHTQGYSQPLDLLSPFTVLNYQILLTGTYPSRN